MLPDCWHQFWNPQAWVIFLCGQGCPGSRGCGMAKVRLSSRNGSKAELPWPCSGSEWDGIRAAFPSEETHIQDANCACCLWACSPQAFLPVWESLCLWKCLRWSLEYDLSGSSPWQWLLAAAGCSLWCLCITCQESSLAQVQSSFQAFLYPQGLMQQRTSQLLLS